MLKFIHNEPALMAGRTLVLADLHIGIEHELSEKGVRLDSPMRGMLRSALSLIEQHSPERLVLLGDVKHNIPSMPFEEAADVSEFLLNVSEKLPVTITPGNHDGNIGRLVKGLNVEISPSEGIAIGQYGFFHGHAWPSAEVMEKRTIIMSHSHPCVELTDKLGARHSMKAWCVGKLAKESKRYPNARPGAKAIIMPAFNPLIRGTALNRAPQNGALGPLLKNNIFKLEQSQIYLLDGTPLGRLSSLALKADL